MGACIDGVCIDTIWEYIGKPLQFGLRRQHVRTANMGSSIYAGGRTLRRLFE